MLKDTIENRNEEILYALGFRYNKKSLMWKLKINSTLVITDRQLKPCKDKDRFERLLLASINHNSMVVKALQNKKTLLIKLLKTVY